MKINCRSCNAVILAEDINLDKVLAKCRTCNAVFDFSAQVQTVAPPAKERRDRGEVPMPSAFRVDYAGHALTVTRKWGRKLAFFFVLFSGFWNMIVSVFVVLAASGKFNEGPPGGPGRFIWIFLTPFISIGLATAYLAVAFLLNRTWIEVRKGVLVVRHGPMPWPGGRTLKVDQLDQLYSNEYVAYSENNHPQYRTALHALTTTGDRIKLVPGMETPEQGVFLENLLEKHLGIKDRPVPGEAQG